MPSSKDLAKVLFDYQRLGQPLKKADLIFLTGSSDLRVAHHAAKIFHQGYAPLILVSGGYGKMTDPKKGITESDRFVKILLDAGIDSQKIITENKSNNTMENIFYAKKIMDQIKIHPKSIIVVCKTSAERRAWATFAFNFPNINITVTSPDLKFDEIPNDIVNQEKFINLMVGDLQRMIIYAGKSLIPQEIPENVMSAYQKLIDLGYTEQLFDPNNLPVPDYTK